MSSDAPGIQDAGLDLCGVLDSEDELQEWLKDAFEEAGWTAIREVSPHSSDYRADLIVEHDRFGWFGIETKFIGTGRGLTNIAKAHHQIIQKYRGRRYIGEKIDLWCVCPYLQNANTIREPGMDKKKMRQRTEYERKRRQKLLSTRPFFQQAGIGWIGLDTYSLGIEFVESTSYGTVPTGYVINPTDYEENYETYKSIVKDRFESCDIKKIQKWAHKRATEKHYGRPNSVRPVEEVGADE